jgi:NAD-dependent SIR2 family protein deacetylase
MKIGNTKVSKTQLELLSTAQTGDLNQVLQGLYTVFNDSDIVNDRETVHPEWVQLFKKNRAELKAMFPDEVFRNIDKAVAQLTAIAENLRVIDPGKNKITFLLGAGASKPKPSNIPTVKELLPHLLERARRLDRDDVSRLSDFCEARKIDNIEDLLTAAQLATFCSRNPTVLKLVDYLLYRREDDEDRHPGRVVASRKGLRATRGDISDLSSVAFLQDTLQVLFGLLASTMLPAKPNEAHKAIAKYCSVHKSTSSVVTTNYDCCMDAALAHLEQNLHYGIEFSNNIRSSRVDREHTQLTKLHGSLNWYYCETCQEVQMVDLATMLDQFAKDKSPYPVIGICKDCGGQRRGLLVPPLAMKFDVAPPLTPLLGQAQANFEKADLIVVVGFSFADADVYISRMLSKSMQTNVTQKIIVADPSEVVAEKLGAKFRASIPNFDITRIMQLPGDCASLLPKFLAGDYLVKKRRGTTSNGAPMRSQRGAVNSLGVQLDDRQN